MQQRAEMAAFKTSPFEQIDKSQVDLSHYATELYSHLLCRKQQLDASQAKSDKELPAI